MRSARAIARERASINAKARAERKAAERKAKNARAEELELDRLIKDYARTPEQRRERPAPVSRMRRLARKRLLENPRSETLS
jgi:hypothetical protein